MRNFIEFKAKKISSGIAAGPALVIRERLSVLGSIDPERGVFIKRGTDLEGISIAGAVLIFISGKGSSSWSGYFKITCRRGNAPAAMINLEIDPLVALACVLNDIPLVQVGEPEIFKKIKNGDIVTVNADEGVIYCQKVN
jgi:predicted aconitase with swiveling domain